MGLAVAGDGAVWFTDNPARALVRLAPDGTTTPFHVSTPVARLVRLAVGPDGSVWVADGTAFGITRLKDGVFTSFVAPTFRASPFGVAEIGRAHV